MYLHIKLESTTCDTIIVELDNWSYYEGLDQIIIEFLSNSLQAP